MTIYLYKKTHNKTGLQYLGKTKQNPHVYSGSGLDWVPHIKEHGNDVTTEILKECHSKEELGYWGRYYSELWNIVKSDKWANRVPETGGGGLYGNQNPMRDPVIASRLSGKNHYSKKKGYIRPKFKTPQNMGRKGSTNGSYNSTIYTWENIKTGERVNYTLWEFRVNIGGSQPHVSKHLHHPLKCKSVVGWKIVR